MKITGICIHILTLDIILYSKGDISPKSRRCDIPPASPVKLLPTLTSYTCSAVYSTITCLVDKGDIVVVSLIMPQAAYHKMLTMTRIRNISTGSVG
jgi:hypothetical protein